MLQDALAKLEAVFVFVCEREGGREEGRHSETVYETCDAMLQVCQDVH
jgi:hypothetical protein